MNRIFLVVVTLFAASQMLSAETLPEIPAGARAGLEQNNHESLNGQTIPQEVIGQTTENQPSLIIPAHITAVNSPARPQLTQSKLTSTSTATNIPEPSLFAVLGIAVAIGAWQILRYKPVTKVVEE